MKNLIFLGIILVIGFCSCKKKKIESDNEQNLAFIQELLESPDTLSIGSYNFVLETYLWRDFMPIAEENGSKMICLNFLKERDSIPLIGTFNLIKQYVIKGDEVWVAEYTEVKHKSNFILQGFVNGGPKWGPDIKVDVVCEFENEGETYRVIGRSQLIEKTE